MTQKWFVYNVLDFASTSLVDAAGSATIASMEDIFYPTENIRHRSTTKEFRTEALLVGGTATGSFVIDCGQPQACDSFLVTGNAATGVLALDSITISGNATNSWSSPAFTTTLTTGDGTLDEEEFFGYKAFGSTQTYRYWKITVSNAGSAGTYAGFSNMFLGEATTFANNAITYGWEFERRDLSITQAGRYGNLFVDALGYQKIIRASMQYLNVAEKEIYQDMIDYCGIKRPVWFVLDSTETITQNKDIEAGYFLFDGSPSLSNAAYGLYNTSFTMVQCI